jgi:hypothetical protein
MIAYADAEAVARSFLDKLNQAIIFPLITLMLTIALVVFLYGCFEYIKGAGNDGARELGKQHILYGIIGMLVMVSAYAILNIAANTFGIDVPN